MIVHGKCDNGFASSNLTVVDIIFKNLYILCDIYNFLHMKVHIYCILSGSITDTLVISDPFIDTTFRNSVHMPFPNYPSWLESGFCCWGFVHHWFEGGEG